MNKKVLLLGPGPCNPSQRVLDSLIEVGGGLGPMAGKTWGIGLMGNNAQAASVDQLVEALKAVLE